MNKRICDYCGEPWPKNQVKLSRTPNAEEIYSELCDVCLKDLATTEIIAELERLGRTPNKDCRECVDTRDYVDERIRKLKAKETQL